MHAVQHRSDEVGRHPRHGNEPLRCKLGVPYSRHHHRRVEGEGTFDEREHVVTRSLQRDAIHEIGVPSGEKENVEVWKQVSVDRLCYDDFVLKLSEGGPAIGLAREELQLDDRQALLRKKLPDTASESGSRIDDTNPIPSHRSLTSAGASTGVATFGGENQDHTLRTRPLARYTDAMMSSIACGCVNTATMTSARNTIIKLG